MMDSYLSVTEAASFLGVSRTTVWAMVRDGRLPAFPDPIDRRQKRIALSELVRVRERGTADVIPRPWPKSIGVYDGPAEVPARDVEEYMAEHWRMP